MHTEVLSLLSHFLGALPAQVSAWDTKVIEHLTADKKALQAFRTGNDDTRWNIYAGIKYRGFVYR
jgi:hypothetical protein